MKRIILFLLMISLVFSIFSSCNIKEAEDENENKNVIKIGVFEPSTGNSASGGKKEILGIKYANTVTPSVDIDGESYTIELIHTDNGSDKEMAVTAAQNLVDQGVSIVIGSYGSDVSIAAYSVFDKAGIPIIGATCTHPNVTIGKDFYYRICFVDTFQATVLSEFAIEKFSATKVYMLGEAGNEYDQGLMAYFEESFTEHGGEIKKDSFPKNNSDFTHYLNNAISFDADVIFMPVSISYATQILLQASALGISTPILGSDTLDDNRILNATSCTDLNLYVSTYYQEQGDANFDQNLINYINTNDDAKALNGGDNIISAASAMGYDAYFVAVNAIRLANSTDSADIKAAIPKVELDGVSGKIVFDEINGDAVRDTAYIKTADNERSCWMLDKVQQVNLQTENPVAEETMQEETSAEASEETVADIP